MKEKNNRRTYINELPLRELSDIEASQIRGGSQLNAEFQADSQIFKSFQEAISTTIDKRRNVIRK